METVAPSAVAIGSGVNGRWVASGYGQWHGRWVGGTLQWVRMAPMKLQSSHYCLNNWTFTADSTFQCGRITTDRFICCFVNVTYIEKVRKSSPFITQHIQNISGRCAMKPRPLPGNIYKSWIVPTWIKHYKQLIRRWDSERELSSRHRTQTHYKIRWTRA